jgi:YD repeat-containing protein
MYETADFCVMENGKIMHNKRQSMKIVKALLILLLPACAADAQYYYKDICITRQVKEQWKMLKAAKVQAVTLTSFDANDQPAEGFSITQHVAQDFSTVTTYTKSTTSLPTALITYYDAGGNVLKTIDTSDTYQSTTEYTYDEAGRIKTISNVSVETDNKLEDREVHIWYYNAQGRPSGMLRIKNSTDTTTYKFVADEKGNVGEERGTHYSIPLPATYYYYDQQNRLTDIVRYNKAADKLLPDYILTWNDASQLTGMLIIPEGTNEYQRWEYSYLQNGLKSAETCYSKRREVLGKVAYSYQSH